MSTSTTLQLVFVVMTTAILIGFFFSGTNRTITTVHSLGSEKDIAPYINYNRHQSSSETKYHSPHIQKERQSLASKHPTQQKQQVKRKISNIAAQKTQNPYDSRRGNENKVFIWSPQNQNCDGDFTTSPAKHSEDGMPYAILRDIVFDRRVANKNHLEKLKPYLIANLGIYARLVVYITAHLSVRPILEKSFVTLNISGNTNQRFDVNLDYFMQTDKQTNRFGHKDYTPGAVNLDNKTISEWQASLSIVPKDPSAFKSYESLMDHLTDISSRSSFAKLQFSFIFLRFDNVQVPFKSWMSLSCATSWVAQNSMPMHLERFRNPPQCHQGPENANGAVLISGSSLYGEKNRNETYFSEITHFAARGLLGPVRFDAVFMTVLAKHSISEISHLCGFDNICKARLHRANNEHLENIRKVVEAGFRDLGIGRSQYNKLILIPACRLGTDAAGLEYHDTCSRSRMHGQFLSLMYAYAMVSPYFKWAASHDMDEIIMPEPGLYDKSNDAKINPISAATMFDSLDVPGYNEGNLLFRWINFLVQREDDVFHLTKQVMEGEQLKFGTIRKVFRDCYFKFGTGKPALRCDKGIGFRIHQTVVRNESSPIERAMHVRYPYRIIDKLRTYHARLHSTRGFCSYLPPKK